MAGKRFAVGRDQHYFARPAAHAGFGKFCVVVGDYVFDADFAAQTVLRVLEKFQGVRELFAGGKKLLAIGEGPTVILDVSEFDAGSGGVFGDGQHFFELIEIFAMHYEIERDGYAARLQPIEDAEFLSVRFAAADLAGGFFARALEAELEVIEAGCD